MRVAKPAAILKASGASRVAECCERMPYDEARHAPRVRCMNPYRGRNMVKFGVRKLCGRRKKKF
jgi:hypothetical protein